MYYSTRQTTKTLLSNFSRLSSRRVESVFKIKIQLIPILQNFIYNCVHFSPFKLYALQPKEHVWKKKTTWFHYFWYVHSSLHLQSFRSCLWDFSKNCWWSAAFGHLSGCLWTALVLHLSIGLCAPWNLLIILFSLMLLLLLLSWILAASLVSLHCFSTWHNKCSAWLCLRRHSSASVCPCWKMRLGAINAFSKREGYIKIFLVPGGYPPLIRHQKVLSTTFRH